MGKRKNHAVAGTENAALTRINVGHFQKIKVE
jgi:hypothetical protein